MDRSTSPPHLPSSPHLPDPSSLPPRFPHGADAPPDPPVGVRAGGLSTRIRREGDVARVVADRPPPAAGAGADHLAALRATGLLDSPPEEAFDRLTRLVCRVLEVPVSLVTFVDEARQFFKSAQGLPEPVATERETPLSHSFCRFVVAAQEPLVLGDARGHAEFCDHPAVRDLDVVAYLGIPLATPGGTVVGSLCAIDTAPRAWSAFEVDVVTDLAAVVMSEMALREHLRERVRAENAVRAREAELTALNETLEARVRDRTAEVVRAYEEMRTLNEELQNFAFVASHDLQEPLRKISAFASLLFEDYGDTLDERAQMYLDRMGASARRMADLLRDLLRYARVVTHGQPFERVDLNVVAGAVLRDLRYALDEVGGALTVDPLPTVEGDPAQLAQLLRNVLSNAVKFRRPEVPPRVRIRAHVDAHVDAPDGVSRCRLLVEDNGIGFDEKYAERVLQPFERLHGSNRYAGTGMGLAICRRIVERHGGGLELRATPGEGTVVTIALPVRQGVRVRG